jgi:signal transduction histidine kinase
MISSVLVILGTLLTLSALAGAGVSRRYPAGIGRFLTSPVNPATWESLRAIIQGFFFGVLGFALMASIFSAGGSLLLVGIGVVLVGLGIEVARVVARVERRRVVIGGQPPLRPHPYLSYGQGWRELINAVFLDLNRWRDVLYVIVAFPLTVLEFGAVAVLWIADLWLLSLPFWLPSADGRDFIAAVPGGLGPDHAGSWAVAGAFVGIALLPVAASVTQGLLTLHRAVVAGLLCESGQRALERRVETLEGSRRAVLDVEASELRRIERDLHDGAQQRLVMLAMGLGMAAEKIDTEPDRAKTMVLEARDQARQALGELRDLVRGIAPSILMDRGLVPAIESLAGRSPVATSVVSTLPPGIRLPDAIERAAYFVVAESLANVAKHASGAATRCEVRCRPDGPNLVVEVWDDGPGGAQAAPGGGLAGLADRVEALDGTLTVDSPEGGPTLVRATIPVAGRLPAPSASGV